MLQTCFGATVTIIEKDISYSFDKSQGNRVYLETKTDEIKGWIVRAGDIMLDSDNSFIMPNEDVEIEALYTGQKYMLTVENFGVITSSLKEAGSEVVARVSEEGWYDFIDWTATGIELDDNRSYSLSYPGNFLL